MKSANLLWLAAISKILFSLPAMGQTLAQDCAIANKIWLAMGRNTSIPSDCCSKDFGITCADSRVIELNWARRRLRGSIPTDIGQLNALKKIDFFSNVLTGSIPSSISNLTGLKELWLQDNLLTGSIPAEIGDLKNLQEARLNNNRLTGRIPAEIGDLQALITLRLYSNQLSGSIPFEIGKLSKLRWLGIYNNQLTGQIPSSIGNLIQLRYLGLQNNQLEGPIPSSLGNLKYLKFLWIYNNNLTGYPVSLSLLTAERLRLNSSNPLNSKLFPNPMPDVPYDLVASESIGTLTNVTMTPFLSTRINRRKRQFTSSVFDSEELHSMCNLNDVQNADVPAGCIAGVYDRFCTNPEDETKLFQCHDQYQKVFDASIFKPLGDVCPAWRKGPRSASCAKAVAEFSYDLFLGIDPFTNEKAYLKLNSMHAFELVSNIFGRPQFAPCQAPARCNWQPTDD